MAIRTLQVNNHCFRSLIFKNPRNQSILHGLNLIVSYKSQQPQKSTNSTTRCRQHFSDQLNTNNNRKRSKSNTNKPYKPQSNKTKETKTVENTDFSNLRGQAPIATRKKQLRNIIVPQEDIIKANRYLGRFLIENRHMPIFIQEFVHAKIIVISRYIKKWTFRVMCEVFYRAKRDKKETT